MIDILNQPNAHFSRSQECLQEWAIFSSHRVKVVVAIIGSEMWIVTICNDSAGWACPPHSLVIIMDRPRHATRLASSPHFNLFVYNQQMKCKYVDYDYVII